MRNCMKDYNNLLKKHTFLLTNSIKNVKINYINK